MYAYFISGHRIKFARCKMRISGKLKKDQQCELVFVCNTFKCIMSRYKCKIRKISVHFQVCVCLRCSFTQRRRLGVVVVLVIVNHGLPHCSPVNHRTSEQARGRGRNARESFPAWNETNSSLSRNPPPCSAHGNHRHRYTDSAPTLCNISIYIREYSRMYTSKFLLLLLL